MSPVLKISWLHLNIPISSDKAISVQLLRLLMTQTPSGMKNWFTPPGKDPQLAEVFAEDEGNMEREVERSSYKYQL